MENRKSVSVIDVDNELLIFNAIRKFYIDSERRYLVFCTKEDYVKFILTWA
jgi:hypothetical protein